LVRQLWIDTKNNGIEAILNPIVKKSLICIQSWAYVTVEKAKQMNKQPIFVFKYGGNAMLNPALRKQVLQNICALQAQKISPVIVHGGGPFIQAALDQAGIASEFIDGQRKTSLAAIQMVEQVLKGRVNCDLVRVIAQLGYRAVGLSGQDGNTVTAIKRQHKRVIEGKQITIDLGQVGDVSSVDPTLVQLLIHNGYIPVLTCIANDLSGQTYNINGDLFAGHLAGALKAEQYIVLTDVDGLRREKDDPQSLIHELSTAQLPELVAEGVIQGGMLPKLESCQAALAVGAKQARIINGTQPQQILALKTPKNLGTRIYV
jgi:acetylglutamate kinase